MNEHNKDLTRLINAPLERVWLAWTDPEQLRQWWGPQGVTNPTCEWEARPGGKIHIVMLAGPDLGELAGQEWPMTGEMLEVVPQQKLVFMSSAIVDGQAVLDARQTVTFEAKGDQTELRVEIEVVRTTPEAAGPLSGMEMGWNQQLDKLIAFTKE
jgi:uncharacterized protein YndB with AHSA1/START domain